ncbi:TetR/AcrR family transcriptional regulator [Nocardia kruczakiae]|uniref:TetR/AcrR family transcriptional regulator n=1 Tax=Nocardia kruczakiae TaxID=261477 RepID=UPI000A07A048|nr:helix-turn-helix domain-containing protein [Nocardia kruczakiae]
MTVSNYEPDVDSGSKRRRSTAVRPTDDTLLDGVVAVFGERGFDGVTMDELAVAADTSKPTLYAHFGGKERLFEACARREAERRFVRRPTEPPVSGNGCGGCASPHS